MRSQISASQEGSAAQTLSARITQGLTEFVPWTGFDYSSDNDFDEDDLEETVGGGAAKKKRKRTTQKQPSADADLIAAATEANLRKLGIDPSSNEGKKQRRRIRNRLSAQLHRERKKGYITYLEGLVRERDAKLHVVSTDICDIIKELNMYRSRLGMTPLGGEVITDYSSGAGHTDSDTGEDSDSVSTSSDTRATPLTQAFGMRPLTGSRYKGSKVGSAFTLLSACLMISITIFGPNIQNVNPVKETDGINALEKLMRADSASGSMLLSITESENSYIAPISATSLTDLNSQGKQLIPSPAHAHGRSLLSSPSSLPAVAHTHGSFDLDLSSASEVSTLSEDITKSLTAHRRLSQSRSAITPSSSQALWQFNNHVADLYPPYVKYYSHDDGGGDYSTNGSHDLKVKTRRNLRTREDTNTSHSILSEIEKRVSRHMLKRYVSNSDAAPVHTEENMGRDLVSVLPTSTSTIPLLQSPVGSVHQTPPSIDYTAQSSGKHISVSRVLLTHGRALLDPSLVVGPIVAKSTVIPTDKEDTVTDTLLKTISTWTGGRAAEDPPVVRVGVNTGGGGADSALSSNMLVMLLPASAVRWGKNWAESSEGTMEAMLNGLNFTDTAHNTRGSNSGSEMGGESEGMWVEIGCSVFKAQLVKNVTLSS